MFQILPQIPPDGFYYTLSMILAGALIWVIKIYLNRTDTTLRQLVDAVAKLDKMLGIHEERHEHHEKQIDELKDVLTLKKKK